MNEPQQLTYEDLRIRSFVQQQSAFRVAAPGRFHDEMLAKGGSVENLISRQHPVLVVKCSEVFKNEGGGKRFALDEAVGAHGILHLVFNSAGLQRVYHLVFCMIDHQQRMMATLLRGEPAVPGPREFYIAEAMRGKINLESKPMKMGLIGLEQAIRNFEKSRTPAAGASSQCPSCRDLLE